MIRYNSLNGIATIFLDRPHRAHAYTPELLDALSNAIQQAQEHTVCIITSTGGRHFCAGADRDSLKKRRAEDALLLQAQRVFDSIATSPTIFIAAIIGPAIAGGFELALSCDLRVVHPQAFFRLPEVSLGLIPAAGGCTRLVELVGPSIAKGMILGGESMDSEQGLRWGLFHRISEDTIEEAEAWGREIAKQNPLSLRIAKEVLNNPSLSAERMGEAILYERRFQDSKE
jgi:enoyl-CoA hydratase/carnithine racemase